MSEEGKEQRIGFKTEVKHAIWRRAGGLCSVKGCLKSVFGSDGNLSPDGATQRATSIGDAAHIFSAREKWARGHGGKTPEFIGSVANGISTCRNCHGNVDSVESKYSADTLFEMKTVPEMAQDLNRHNPVVGFYVSRIGTEHLDNLVWNAADRADQQSITEAFIIYAESAVQVLRSLKNSIGHAMPSPKGFERRPIVSAMHRAIEPQEFVFDRATLGPIQNLHFADLRQKKSDQIARTIELVESWSCGQDNVYFYDTVRCEFFTRDLVTGAAGEPVIFNVLAGALKSDGREGGRQTVLQVRRFEDYSVGFEWEVEATANKDGHSLSSTLKLASFACPDATDDDHEFQVFAGYARLLKEINSGKQPCARLSKHNSMSRYEAQIPRNEDHLHPLEFVMDVLDSPERIGEVVSFNEKALLGYRLSCELHAPIIYRRASNSEIPGTDPQNAYLLGFFDHRLSEQLIRGAIHEVRAKAGFDRRGRFGAISDPLVTMQVYGCTNVIRAYHDAFYTRFKCEAAPRPTSIC